MSTKLLIFNARIVALTNCLSPSHCNKCSHTRISIVYTQRAAAHFISLPVRNPSDLRKSDEACRCPSCVTCSNARTRIRIFAFKVSISSLFLLYLYFLKICHSVIKVRISRFWCLFLRWHLSLDVSPLSSHLSRCPLWVVTPSQPLSLLFHSFVITLLKPLCWPYSFPNRRRSSRCQPESWSRIWLTSLVSDWRILSRWSVQYIKSAHTGSLPHRWCFACRSK